MKYRLIDGEYIPDPEFNHGTPLLNIPVGDPGKITSTDILLLHKNTLYVVFRGGGGYDRYLAAFDKYTGRPVEGFSVLHYHGLSEPLTLQIVNNKIYLIFDDYEDFLMYRTDLMGNIIDRSRAFIHDRIDDLYATTFVSGYEVQPENLTSLTRERVIAYGQQLAFYGVAGVDGARVFWRELAYRPVKEPVRPKTVTTTGLSTSTPVAPTAPDSLAELPSSSAKIPMVNTIIMIWALISSQIPGG